MTLEELRAAFRSETDDVSKPYKWSDAEIAGYFNDAESQAARRALLLYDDETPSVCTINVVSGTSRYGLSKKIIRVDKAYLSTAKRLLTPTDETYLDNVSPGGNDYANSLGGNSWRSSTGSPYFFLPRAKKIQLVPVPTAADTLQLAVYRTPVRAMADKSHTPEIAETYHMQLLDWALHRAYLKHDADAFDADFSKIHEAKFTASFGVLPGADVDRSRNQRRGAPAVRYGGL